MARTQHEAGASSIDELIQNMATLGERTAIRFRTEYRGFSWSYRQLHTAVLQMGAFLQERGLRSGERVILWAGNSPAWIITFLACLLNGNVAVPLDLRSQPSFIKDVARETDAKLLITSRFKRNLGLGVPQVCVEEIGGLLSHYQNVQPTTRLGANRIAEIVYTSGTVARPKGVVITCENVAAELRSLSIILPDEPEYRFLAVLPFSHIFAQVVDLFLPLSLGATIVLLETVTPAAIATALRREKVTVLAIVPRMLELLYDSIRFSFSSKGGVTGQAMSIAFELLLQIASCLPFGLRRMLFAGVHASLGGKLKYLVSGGSALNPGLERAWERLGFVALQGYGLTETTAAVASELLDARRIGSVGRVLPGQEVRLGDKNEILVRGANVTPGYFANPTATTAAFEDGWLKTGDIGYLDRDGFLYVKGRMKEVIVTSAGLNVYPEDIEVVLARQRGVRDSAVVEWQGGVHAVLLLEQEADPKSIVVNANRALDSGRQVQGYTVWPFAEFPRTITSKVRKRDVLEFLRRRTLPEETKETLVSPATRLDHLLARLDKGDVSALRSDASLGLDLKLASIDRLELVSRIEQELNVDIADEEITAETTVGQLERMVEERQRGKRHVFPRWARSPFVRALRDVFQRFLIFPLVRTFVHLTVTGQEHLVGLEEPSIFAANHQSHLDAVVIYMALPKHLRRRIAVAAWAEYFEAQGRSWPMWILRRMMYYAAVLLVNAFPLSQVRIARPSLQYMGELVEEGESILIFPEGRRTPTGETQPFREGIGLVATALRVPVIPVRLDGLFDIAYSHGNIPRPGKAMVSFGAPLRFVDEIYQEVARSVGEAVEALRLNH